MSPGEKARVDQFMIDVESGALRVRRGELARQLREYVNPDRPPEFFEKLVSRRQMNKRFGKILGPKAPRRSSRAGDQTLVGLSAPQGLAT